MHPPITTIMKDISIILTNHEDVLQNGSFAEVKDIFEKTVAKYSYNHDIDLAMVDENNRTLAFYVVQTVPLPVMLDVLREGGADLNHRDAQGNTLAHMATNFDLVLYDEEFNDKIPVFLEYLATHIDVRVPNTFGETPLFGLSVDFNKTSREDITHERIENFEMLNPHQWQVVTNIVDTLIEFGVDPMVINYNNERFTDQLKKSGTAEMQNWLEPYLAQIQHKMLIWKVEQQRQTTNASSAPVKERKI